MSKRYFYAEVNVNWGKSFEASSKEEFIIMLKDQFKQDYNIELSDSEIKVEGV